MDGHLVTREPSSSRPEAPARGRSRSTAPAAFDLASGPPAYADRRITGLPSSSPATLAVGFVCIGRCRCRRRALGDRTVALLTSAELIEDPTLHDGSEVRVIRHTRRVEPERGEIPLHADVMPRGRVVLEIQTVPGIEVIGAGEEVADHHQVVIRKFLAEHRVGPEALFVPGDGVLHVVVGAAAEQHAMRLKAAVGAIREVPDRLDLDLVRGAKAKRCIRPHRLAGVRLGWDAREERFDPDLDIRILVTGVAGIADGRAQAGLCLKAGCQTQDNKEEERGPVLTHPRMDGQLLTQVGRE